MSNKILKFVYIFHISIIQCIFSQSYAIYQNNISHTQYNPLFPQTPYVAKQVRFWENVFSKFNSSQFLIHDTKYPDIVIDLIDLTVFEQKYGKELINKYGKDYIIQQYLSRYQLGLDRFSKLQYNAIAYGPIERRLYNVYSKNFQALESLYKGLVSIRAQVGLKEQFEKALIKAQQWFPYMERTFSTYGLPKELTRLVFVESMFDHNAVSKAGAKGMWQFMPDTAKQYLIINRYIDERHSPYKSTKAAAKFLKYLYQTFRSWPLAITAYNHGPSSLMNAVKTLNTKNLDIILQYYSAPSFGFASRNYYAEFIATINVYRKLSGNSSLRNYNQENSRYSSVVALRLQRPLSVHDIINKSSINIQTFKEYNPCILDYAFKNPAVTLPKGFEIFLPTSLATKFILSLNQTKNNSNINRLRF